MFHQESAASAPLEVSVQILSFAPGLYRVSFISQRGVADPGIGFPWARLETPPGAKLRQSVIAVQGENEWLSRTGDTAIVQVAGEQAPLLLTIYQVKGVGVPPEFRVERLDVQSDATVRPETPATQATSLQPLPNGVTRSIAHETPAASQSVAGAVGQFTGVAHVHGRDLAVGADGWAGLPGSSTPLEGFALTFSGPPDVGVEYSATLGPDWSTSWVKNGGFCGSRGLSLPLLGLTARLVGASAERFHLRCFARFVGGRETGPVPVDELCAAPDGKPIEAFRFVVTSAAVETEAVPAAARTPEAAPAPRAPRAPRTKQAPAKPAGQAPAKPAGGAGKPRKPLRSS